MPNNTIFAVDDERPVLELYESVLGKKKRDRLDFFNQLEKGDQDESEGFDVRVFESGESYLKALREHYDKGERVPLSILDMRLPGIHGLELAKEVRKTDPEMIILIVTAYSDYTVQELIGQLQYDIYYLKKPFRSDELYALVTSTLYHWNAKTEASVLRKELAIDAIQDGLWDWDTERNEVYFSPRWKEMLGYRDDEIHNVFSEWSDRMHPDDRERAMMDMKAHLDQATPYYINEHRLWCKDGSYKWILSRGKAIFNDQGKALRMTGFNTDITERKRLEEELGHLNTSLNNEIDLNVSQQMKLQHTNAELEKKLLEEIDKRREKEQLLLQSARHAAMGEMISMIAHQWRQPITGIGMAANNMVLDIDMDTVDLEKHKKNLKLIQEQVSYLSNTIDDFRNFFKPDKTQENLYIHEIINDTFRIIGKTFEKSNIHIETDFQDKTKLNLYRNEMIQVFLNILNNAKDAFEENKTEHKTLSFTTRETERDSIIEIRDNAGGIPKDVLPKIFEPYFSTKYEKTGTGLGLYMSKMIIEEHMKGSLNANNSDRGAVFTITFKKTDNQSEDV